MLHVYITMVLPKYNSAGPYLCGTDLNPIDNRTYAVVNWARSSQSSAGPG